MIIIGLAGKARKRAGGEGRGQARQRRGKVLIPAPLQPCIPVTCCNGPLQAHPVQGCKLTLCKRSLTTD
eukprot:1159075-Pelagomonas_calceolata.AAC.6